jgi:hypothetical protein
MAASRPAGSAHAACGAASVRASPARPSGVLPLRAGPLVMMLIMPSPPVVFPGRRAIHTGPGVAAPAGAPGGTRAGWRVPWSGHRTILSCRSQCHTPMPPPERPPTGYARPCSWAARCAPSGVAVSRCTWSTHTQEQTGARAAGGAPTHTRAMPANVTPPAPGPLTQLATPPPTTRRPATRPPSGPGWGRCVRCGRPGRTCRTRRRGGHWRRR